MTNGEIALAIIAACFAAYGLLMSFGNYFDRRRFSKQVETAQAEVKRAQMTTKLMSRGWHALDRGVGRAVCRIISAHSEEHCLRRGTDPDSYYPGQGKEHAFIAQGMLRALNILEEETGRYKEEKEDPSPAYRHALARHMEYEAKQRVGAPAHGPVTAPCAVCGGHACTYRWGQWVSRWDSMSNIRGTFATTRWQEFDPDLEVGWFPVCARHANDLDGGENIVVRRVGYHRG